MVLQKRERYGLRNNCGLFFLLFLERLWSWHQVRLSKEEPEAKKSLIGSSLFIPFGNKTRQQFRRQRRLDSLAARSSSEIVLSKALKLLRVNCKPDYRIEFGNILSGVTGVLKQGVRPSVVMTAIATRRLLRVYSR
jgi:hypothetical protein